MEPEGSLLCSQEPATGSYPESCVMTIFCFLGHSTEPV
jgi:hypothetical protein